MHLSFYAISYVCHKVVLFSSLYSSQKIKQPKKKLLKREQKELHVICAHQCAGHANDRSTNAVGPGRTLRTV